MKNSRYRIQYNGLEDKYSIIDRKTKKILYHCKKLQSLMLRVNKLRRKEIMA